MNVVPDLPVLIDGWYYRADNRIVRQNKGDESLTQPLKHVRKFDVAIDGGAYVGRTAGQLAERFKWVWAYEIEPLNQRCLKMNLANFNLRNVTPMDMALGDHIGRVGYEPDSHPDSPVFMVGQTTEQCAAGMTTIDIGAFKDCDFIKLDLQGYEYFALKGAVETIARCKPILYFEHEAKCYRRYGVFDRDIPDLLKSLGYKRIAGGNNETWGPK